MEKPILLVDFGRLMDDQLRNGLNVNKKTFILDDYVVEAIPIEWIEKWAEKFYKEINGKRYYMGDGYDTVWDMLEDWEKENE